jgi:HEAT repeat protein
MLDSSDAEIREDGGSILAALGRSEDMVSEVLVALEAERDDQARDSLVIALGELRDRRAIPALAALIRAPGADGDTRHTAAQSLGRLVRRRFDKTGDPVPEALRWLDEHEH